MRRGSVRFLSWFKRRKKNDVVVVDDQGVTRRLADGTEESVYWRELIEVGVLTTDEGPWIEDVFFVLVGERNSGCVIPQGAEGASVLVDRILELPGFNEKLFIEAMGTTSNKKFVCWKRHAA